MPKTNIVKRLLAKHVLVSDQVSVQELEIVLEQLSNVLDKDVKGDVVELGCYQGTTSLFLQRLLVQTGSTKQLHVYDSFAGLPPKSAQDTSPVGEQFKTGELLATKSQLIMNFKKANLLLPTIHKVWFSEMRPSEMPESIAFAFLDGDYYESIKLSLTLLEPKLSAGAIVIIDDYHNEALPGAAIAVDEWRRRKVHIKGFQVIKSLAVIEIA